MPLGIKLVDENNVSVLTSDGGYSSTLTSTLDHVLTNEGCMYQIGNLVTITAVASGAVITTCSITTGTKITHMKPRIYVANLQTGTTNAISVNVWENPIVTLGASTKVPSNRNRNKPDASLNTLYYASTYTSGGTSFGTSLITPFSMTNIGVTFSEENEFILLPNSTYVWSFSNVSTGALTGYLNYRFNWYEIDP